MTTPLIFLALLLIGLAMLAFGFLDVRASRKTLERRVNLVAPAPPSGPAAGGPAPNGEGAKENVLIHVFGFGLRSRWGMKTSATLLLVSAVAGAIAGLALTHLLKTPLWAQAAAAVVCGVIAPRTILVLEQGRAETAFLDQFPDAMDMIIRMLRAGLPITAAMRTVGSEAQPPLNAVFARLADQLEIGIALEDTLMAASRRIDLPDFRFFTVAAAMQHATGGNLAVTLEILADMVRKRRALRMKARAVTGEVRMTTYVLAAIPFFIVSVLLIFFPAYLAVLTDDPRGRVIAGVAVASLITGFVIMRQMMRSVTRI